MSDIDEGPEFEAAVRELERALDTGDAFTGHREHAPNPTEVRIPLGALPPEYDLPIPTRPGVWATKFLVPSLTDRSKAVVR